MDVLLDAFIGVLENEIDIYRSLLLILQQEKEAVVFSKLRELDKSSKEKENHLLKIRILEEQRIKFLEKIADSLEYPSPQLTLNNLIQIIAEPYATRLRNAYNIISALVQAIQEVNNSNKALILHSLDLVRGSLALFNNLICPTAVYFRSGKVIPNAQRGVVISGKT
jgi:flagellar biosynthesis/type III secretory pathway chaperone